MRWFTEKFHSLNEQKYNQYIMVTKMVNAVHIGSVQNRMVTVIL